MSRIMQLSWLIGVLILSSNAIAQETADPEAEAEAVSSEAGQDAQEASTEPEPAPEEMAEPEPETEPEAEETAAPEAASDSFLNEPWKVGFSGYFRAPFMVSFSKRTPPGMNSKELEVSLGGNRLVDADYGSFGFTRLNEGDWAQFFLEVSRKHVKAVIGMMGGFYQWVGDQNVGGIFSTGLGWLELDTDFKLGSIRPHILLRAGSFQHSYGYYGYYDNYMYARHHQSGEMFELTVPFNDNFALKLNDGVGYYRKKGIDDNYGAAMLHHLYLGASIIKKIDLGFYLNNNWSKDPVLYGVEDASGAMVADPVEARKAKMTVLGADLHLRLPRFGHLWFAYSHIKVENSQFQRGWGTEVMESTSGANGIANNYLMGASDGATNNIGWLYEMSLSGLRGLDAPSFPELKMNLFGLMAAGKIDGAAPNTPDSTLQLKGGADLTLYPISWLGLMVRYDGVSLDLKNKIDDARRNFHVITPRVILKSHLLSNEVIWVQFSHYMYGDGMTINYNGTPATPDENVVKLMIEFWW